MSSFDVVESLGHGVRTVNKTSIVDCLESHLKKHRLRCIAPLLKQFIDPVCMSLGCEKLSTCAVCISDVALYDEEYDEDKDVYSTNFLDYRFKKTPGLIVGKIDQTHCGVFCLECSETISSGAAYFEGTIVPMSDYTGTELVSTPEHIGSSRVSIPEHIDSNSVYVCRAPRWEKHEQQKLLRVQERVQAQEQQAQEQQTQEQQAQELQAQEQL